MTTVHVPEGILDGRDCADGTYFFGGVPYAERPLGDLRFRPPQRPASWEGVRPAHEPGPAAPQRPVFAAVGEVYSSILPQSEDCLTLTVRTPSLTADRLPVFVWIHGGGFAVGSGGEPIYQGGGLSRHGVVEVSVTHRLGALGFAAINDPRHGLIANAGLRDVIAALAWVQERIEAFGGDPGNVSLAGHSAGAMTVACLMTSPLAQGLFHRAVIQSPGAPFAVDLDTGLTVTKDLASRVGVSSDSVEGLAGAPLDDVLAAQLALSDLAYAGEHREQFGGASMAFNPVIDGDVLPAEPLAAIAGGAAAGVPLLVGSARDEAMLHLEAMVAATESEPAGSRAVLDAILARFPGQGSTIESTYREEFPASTDARLAATILGDAALRLPALSLAAAAAPHGPVFCYRFDEPTVRAGWVVGAIHGAELPYLFGTGSTVAGQHLAGQVDERLASSMQLAWTEFARTGRPDLNRTAWPQYSTSEASVLAISADAISTVSDLTEALATLWLSPA
jgi:para-nitrobenzyl esterase